MTQASSDTSAPPLPGSISEATAAGLMYYYTGKPCKHGHVAIRYAPNGSCVPCMRSQSRRWSTDHPEVISEWNRRYRIENAESVRGRKSKYGRENIEKLREYRRRWKAQPGRMEILKVQGRKSNRKRLNIPEPTRPEPSHCECCGSPPVPGKILHLDHCHASGTFRGWLCMRCNTAIGKLGDNLDGLMKAVAYIQRATTK